MTTKSGVEHLAQHPGWRTQKRPKKTSTNERVTALENELRNLIDAAKLVVERWETGDLADAVNGLRVDADHAAEVVAGGKSTPRKTITEDEPIRFRNHYRCLNDGTEWSDDWSCTCNDHCPTCDAEIEPYESDDI